MAEKQHQLNGAYYGPSIPPPKSYHRPGRDSGCCCGCCGCIFSCIFSCICNLICKLLTTIIIIVAIVAFLFWLIVRPNVVRFHVTHASLTQFNYTNNNTLHYNLALNITVRNPNKRLGIYYDYIEARALYRDARFDSQFLDPFYQRHKTTNVLNPVFKGQQLIPLGADQISELNKEKKSGVYEIDVKLYMKVRFKLGLFKTGKLKPKISCDLKVPLTSAANRTSPAGEFQTTECGWDY